MSDTYEPRGAALLVQSMTDQEILISGPAGTGKTRAVLEKIHRLCTEVPRLRVCFVRQVRKALTQSVMVTFSTRVLPIDTDVVFNHSAQEYRYANGSIIVVAGLDDPAKLMSSEYDIIFINEATEATEAAVEMVTTRLRAGGMGFDQLIMDCNPSTRRHWLLRRAERGDLKMLYSVYEDNPYLWDAEAGEWTPAGTRYIKRLDKLTGARKQRLRLGIWAGEEDVVYEEWSPKKHRVRPRSLDIQERYISLSLAFNRPCVAQWWARTSENCLYRYREVYTSGVRGGALLHRVRELTGGEQITALLYDPKDPHVEGVKRLGFRTREADTREGQGINALAARLAVRGRAGGVRFVRGSQEAPSKSRPVIDPVLLGKGASICTEDEFEVYTWLRDTGGELTDRPNDAVSAGLTAARFLVATLDLHWSGTGAHHRLLGRRLRPVPTRRRR